MEGHKSEDFQNIVVLTMLLLLQRRVFKIEHEHEAHLWISDRQKRQTEAGDGRWPFQHPAAEEKEEGEEDPHPQETRARARGCGQITIFYIFILYL